MKSARRSRIRLLTGGAALILIFVGSAAYDSWRLYQQVMSANERELSNLTNALAEEASRNLQSVDLMLRDTAAWYEGSTALAPADISQALKSRSAGVAQVSVLTIVDASGHQRYRSRDTGEPLADVADRPYFRAQRDSPRKIGLFVNPPIVTRTEHLPSLVLSRRLRDRAGNFDGVVTASVTLDQLQAAYAAIHLGEGSSLVLTTGDGMLVVRQPRMPELEGGRRFPELVALKDSARVAHATSPIDGRMKLVSAVGVGGESLVLSITRDEQQALRPWYDDVRSSTIRTTVISLLIMLTTAGLLRQLRRQERSAAALRTSEERYAMAMEAANEGHAEWTVLPDKVFASQKWRALHGIPLTASIESSTDLCREVRLHPDDERTVTESLAEHLAGRSVAIEIDYRVGDGAGGWRWIHSRGRCLLDAQGSPLRLFCSAIDVSERKNAELDRSRFEARVQQTRRLEAVGTLAGGIAHDFNNILASILGFGEMAHERSAPGSDQRRYLDQVLQSGARARLLVRKILDFSRSGVAQRGQVRIESVVDEVAQMLTPTVPPHLRIVLQSEAGDAAVLGDATDLYQVVMNLCTNAIQAIEDAGTVTILLERRHLDGPRACFLGELPAGEYACIRVSDTGIGIDADKLTRIFDPFYSTKRVGEGTGLGLSVVHGVVSELGGAIDLVSEKGRGTAITVWLPICGELPPAASAESGDWPQGNGETVMIVDDEIALVRLAEELLAGLGYEPIGFESSSDAIRAFEADPLRFDAVLSDEAMPGLRGSEMAKLMLAIRPTLPFLLMSGNLDDEAGRAARASGIAGILHKPLGLRQIAEALAGLLRAARPLAG